MTRELFGLLLAVLVSGCAHQAEPPRVALEASTQAAQPAPPPATAHPFDRAAPVQPACDATAQTTLDMVDCMTAHIDVEKAWRDDARASLDPQAARSFDAANKAFDAYAFAVGSIAYAKYEGGSLRSPAMQGQIFAMLRARRGRLVDVGRKSAGPADVAAAKDEVTRALEGARKDAVASDERTAIDDAERTFAAYRDAELALYARFEPGLRDVILAKLLREHAADLRNAASF